MRERNMSMSERLIFLQVFAAEKLKGRRLPTISRSREKDLRSIFKSPRGDFFCYSSLSHNTATGKTHVEERERERGKAIKMKD